MSRNLLPVPSTLTAAWNGSSPVAAPAGTVAFLGCPNDATAGLSITGTFSATLVFEYSQDYSQATGVGTWNALSVYPVGNAASVTSATSTGNWLVDVAGFVAVRARCSTYTSGSAVVTWNATAETWGGEPGPIASGTATIGATQDAGPAWTSVHGISGVPFTSSDQHSAAANCTDAPTTGLKLVITDLVFATDTAMNVTFKEETSGTVIAGPFYVAANSTVQLTPRSIAWKLATANKHLQVITSVSGNIMVDAFYFSA